jgi:hypothetical protein
LEASHGGGGGVARARIARRIPPAELPDNDELLMEVKCVLLEIARHGGGPESNARVGAARTMLEAIRDERAYQLTLVNLTDAQLESLNSFDEPDEEPTPAEGLAALPPPPAGKS